MLRLTAPILLLTSSLTATSPARLLLVDVRTPGIRRALAEAGATGYGQTDNWLLLEPTAAAWRALDSHGARQRWLALDPALSTYLAQPRTARAQDRLAGHRPLLRDGNLALIQLAESDADALSASGAQLIRLPDRPIPVRSPVPRFFPRAADADTFVQRLVNAVDEDTIRTMIRRLQDFRTRYSRADSCRAAEQYVADYFTHLGLDSVELHVYQHEGDTWRNAVGTIVGVENPEKIIIVCGHLDATSEDPYNDAPGAEDNASGTAVALEAARVMAGGSFGMTVKFIAFTGEEQGLIGSRYYAGEMRARGADIVAALNFDMIAWPGGQFGVDIYTDTASFPLGEFEGRMADRYTGLDNAVRIGRYGSDQISFHENDYPATAGAEYGSFYPWYHTTADTIGNLSMPLAAEVTRMAIATAATIATAPAPPTGFVLADAGGGGTLTAAWQPNSEPDLAGYKLLWGTSSRTYSDSVLLGRVTTHDISGLVNGTRYHATVVAIDSAGHESGEASERSAVPGFMPLPPAGFVARPIRNGVALDWLPNRELDLAGYRLYRSTTSGSGYRLLNSELLADTTYRDSGLMADTMYYYVATAVDTLGTEGNRSVEAGAKPVTLDHGILLVDETRDGNGSPGSPDDSQQDAFYHHLLRGYRYTDWDVAADGQPLAGDIGPYSTVVWHGDDYANPRLHPSLPGLANYLALGGRLWLVGWKPAYSLMNGIGRYPHQFEPGDFAHDWLHTARAEQSETPDFVGANGRAGYPDAAVDSAKALPALHGRLPYIDAILPRDADTVLTFNSFSGDTFDGKPVGIRWLTEPGKIVFFGFPLFYIRDDDARDLARRVLDDLGEVYAIEEGREPVAAKRFAVTISPNPTLGAARIGFSLPRGQHVRVALYDATGELVRALVDVPLPAGRHTVTWDGRDRSNRPLPSGVYFCRLEGEAETRTVRTELLR